MQVIYEMIGRYITSYYIYIYIYIYFKKQHDWKETPLYIHYTLGCDYQRM